jgi:hypothetical protein
MRELALEQSRAFRASGGTLAEYGFHPNDFVNKFEGWRISNAPI